MSNNCGNTEAFIERLDILLHEYDMNRSQLARRLRVAVSTVHRWFSRGSIPNGDTVAKISQIFGISEKWLFGLTEDRKTIEEKSGITAEEGDNQEIISLVLSLNPAQRQRVKDFIAGIKG